MPRSPTRSARRSPTSPTPNIYQEITDRIIADLEAGCVPWTQPWSAAGSAAGLPHNAATARNYSGINILLLWRAARRGGFARPGWLSFRQALALGGHVRRGETGTMIVYADRFTPRAAEQTRPDQGDRRSIPFLKRFTVFNVEQCEALPEAINQPEPAPALDMILPHARAAIEATGAEIRIGGNDAYYAPALDRIQVPPPEAFFAPVDWHRTAFHELTHWTGAKHRLARDQSGTFGSPAYAREELVAEMGGAFLCARLGIEPTVRHADYIASWLGVLRKDARAIVRAASAACRAADYILSFSAPPSAPALKSSAAAGEVEMGCAWGGPEMVGETGSPAPAPGS